MPEPVEAAGAPSTIQRRLGAFDTAMVVVSLVIGIGIFRTPAIVAGQAGTPFAFYAVWVLGGFISLCGALTYAEIGSRLPRAGGQYRAVAEAYHPMAGVHADLVPGGPAGRGRGGRRVHRRGVPEPGAAARLRAHPGRAAGGRGGADAGAARAQLGRHPHGRAHAERALAVEDRDDRRPGRGGAAPGRTRDGAGRGSRHARVLGHAGRLRVRRGRGLLHLRRLPGRHEPRRRRAQRAPEPADRDHGRAWWSSSRSTSRSTSRTSGR